MLRFVTPAADFRLRGDLLHRILSAMHLVAIGTPDIVGGMRTRAPIVSRVSQVASEAHRVLSCDRSLCTGTEIHDSRPLSSFGFDMRSPGAMTGLALETAVTERSPWIVGLRVLGPKEGQYLWIVMAAQAGVGSLRTVGGWRWRGSGVRGNAVCRVRADREESHQCH